MYMAYSNKKDSPVLRTFMYISLVLYFIGAVFIIYLDKIFAVGKIIPESTLHTMRSSYTLWGVMIIFILLFVYIRFTRKDFSYYEEKYSKCHSLNKSIKIWMLIAFPFLFFFISIFLIAPLFGGAILGKKINGIFSN